MSLKPKTFLRYTLSLVVIALLGIFATMNYHYQRDALDLVDFGERVEGVVTNKQCANAGLVDYSFSLAEKMYRGSSNACVVSCPKALIGERVAITYSTKNPNNSTCGSVAQVASRFNGNYFALLLVGLGLLVVIFKTTNEKS